MLMSAECKGAAAHAPLHGVYLLRIYGSEPA